MAIDLLVSRRASEANYEKQCMGMTGQAECASKSQGAQKTGSVAGLFLFAVYSIEYIVVKFLNFYEINYEVNS